MSSDLDDTARARLEAYLRPFPWPPVRGTQEIVRREDLRALLAAHDALLAAQAQDVAASWRNQYEGMKAEVERLGGLLNAAVAERDQLVREWVCEACHTVYPGPPARGVSCIVCPACGGGTMPMATWERRRLLAEQDDLANRLGNVREQRDQARRQATYWERMQAQAAPVLAALDIYAQHEHLACGENHLGALVAAWRAAQEG